MSILILFPPHIIIKLLRRSMIIYSRFCAISNEIDVMSNFLRTQHPCRKLQDLMIVPDNIFFRLESIYLSLDSRVLIENGTPIILCFICTSSTISIKDSFSFWSSNNICDKKIRSFRFIDMHFVYYGK